MTPTLARTWMLGAGVVLALATLVFAVATRRRGILRPAGVAIILGAAGLLVYEGLAVAGIARETYLRFRYPLALV
ncbi:MAG TPA: hypothetical protein VF765_30265, partial [Polyangiaceae bacterium]